MNPYYYDLHTHSALSPCGDNMMTPNNLAGMAALAGIRVLALTDHNTCKNCPAFFAACKRYGVVPVPGMELTTAEEIHVVCLLPTLEAAMDFDRAVEARRMKIENNEKIFGEQLIFDAEDNEIGRDPWFLPAATDLPIEKAAALVRSFGGLCYPAHIDRESNGLLAILGTFPEKPVFGLAEVRERKNTALAEGRKLIVSSDAHRLWELNQAENFIHLDASPDDSAETVRAALFAALRAAEAEWQH